MKTPRLKASSAKSVRSRAARREVSPSLDVDRSLTSLPRAEWSSTGKPSVLGTQHSSGVSKKKQKPQTRAQRLRQEKGLERAEIVMDKTEKKVAKSLAKGKVVKSRNTTWDDMNKRTNAYKALQEAESMDTSDKEEQSEQPKPTASSNRSAPLAPPVQEEQFEFELDGEIT